LLILLISIKRYVFHLEGMNSNQIVYNIK